MVVTTAFTDPAGRWSLEIPGLSSCSCVGLPLVLQAVVRSGSVPGPIPGIDGWLSNGVEMMLGLP